MAWETLDNQLAQWSHRLKRDLNITENEGRKLATNIASEIRFLPQITKMEMIAASPVPLADRLQELEGFQGWMDTAHQSPRSPYLTRAQVITQNYICFVYLPESCFRVLGKATPSGSVTRKCAQFLTNNPVRAFRNAIAHANWTYREDFQALTYWARKGASPDDSLVQFEVVQEELTFWQALSRCVAYAAFLNL
jgi:hypothetical protein